MTQTELSRDDELKLLGLKVLALRHSRMLDDIRDAVLAIVAPGHDRNSESGHVSDYIFGGDDNTSPQDLWALTARDREARHAD